MTPQTASMTEEEALWQAVGANPADSLPRMVLADWYEERAGRVACGCKGGQVYGMGEGYDGIYRNLWSLHKRCSGTGYISNGYAETAAALRATADRVPSMWACGRDGDDREFVFERSMTDQPEPQFYSYLGAGPFAAQGTADLSVIEFKVFDEMEGESGGMYFMIGKHGHRHYPTALAAIKDLCAAWVKVHKSEAQS